MSKSTFLIQFLTFINVLFLSFVSFAADFSECQKIILKTQEIPFSKLSYYLTKTRDIHLLVAELEKAYGKKDFVVRIPFSKRRFYFLQDPELVRIVLKKKTSLGFPNENFNISHGHSRSINAVNASEELWSDLHTNLLDIFNNTSIAPIMEKYKDILIGQSEYNLNHVLEEFFLKVWSEYTFGEVNLEQYTKTRIQLIDVLGKTFHKNRLNRLPVIGKITSQFNYKRYLKEIESVDQSLSSFLESSIEQKKGAFFQLYERLVPKYGKEEAFLIARDNSFLGVLVYDFIYGVLLDYKAKTAKDLSLDKKQQLQKSMKDAFLYPWRFRVAEEKIEGAEKNDFFMINLVEAGTYFSYGMRVCAGARLFGEISKKLNEIYANTEISFTNPLESIDYNGSKDIPIMQSSHQVQVVKNPASKCPFHRSVKK